ncbi:hypothetical protein [Corynebacterium variabile]|uniref:hypothetical protein n=1 Tax=Corynebacterium variabile TaxID=1727 RepID=UPI0028AE2289|nr:hypothetical protein [Corynebacterium variabile]
MKKKAAGAAILAGAIALGLSAAPASADSVRVDFGSSVVDVPVPDGLGPILNQVIPGDLNGIMGSASGLGDILGGGTGGGVSAGSNRVAKMTMELNAWQGRTLGPQIYGKGFFPWIKWSARDTSNHATYKTASCQGGLGVRDEYKTPGNYTIKVLDRVSGKSASQSFRVE